MIALPSELENQLGDKLRAFEEEKQMPYVTSVERRATLKTRQDSIIEALEVRFGSLPEATVDQVTQLNDTDQLQALFKQAILVESLDAFQELLDARLSAQ